MFWRLTKKNKKDEFLRTLKSGADLTEEFEQARKMSADGVAWQDSIREKVLRNAGYNLSYPYYGFIHDYRGSEKCRHSPIGYCISIREVGKYNKKHQCIFCKGIK